MNAANNFKTKSIHMEQVKKEAKNVINTRFPTEYGLPLGKQLIEICKKTTISDVLPNTIEFSLTFGINGKQLSESEKQIVYNINTVYKLMASDLPGSGASGIKMIGIDFFVDTIKQEKVATMLNLILCGYITGYETIFEVPISAKYRNDILRVQLALNELIEKS